MQKNQRASLLMAGLLACAVGAQAQPVDRVVVKLKASPMVRAAADDAQLRIKAAAGVAPAMTMGDGQSQVLQLPKDLSATELQAYIKKLQASGQFESVEADIRMYPQAQAVPNDPFFDQMWHFKPVVPMLNYGADFPGAWEFSTGEGITVAVVDTGIVPHPDLGTLNPVGGNLASAGYTFISDCYMAGKCEWKDSKYMDPFAGALDEGDWCTSADVTNRVCDRVSSSSFHGSHVAGTIAALGFNGQGVIGGAYNARILPVRVLGKGGGSAIDIADGIRWAAGVHPTIPNPNPARVINMSLGGSSATCPSYYQSAIDDAVRAGVIVVVAAGNETRDAAQSTPANCQRVITVAATGKVGERASYSNFGSKVTLAAQGGNGANRVLSTVNLSPDRVNLTPSGYGVVGMNGTSMATPHVAATVALMLAANPKLTFDDIVSLLRQSATAFPQTSCTTATCGAGILNAAGAVRLARQSAGNGTEPLPTPTIMPTPTRPPVVTPLPTLRPTAAPTAVPTVAPTAAPTPGSACYTAWQEGKLYQAGDLVTYAGRNYRALTTHQAYVGANWNPKASQTLWQDVGACNGGVTPTATPKPVLTPTPAPVVTPSATPSLPPQITPVPTKAVTACAAWSADAVYTAGQCASHGGQNYKAKWWTRGEAPGASQWGPWVSVAASAAKR